MDLKRKYRITIEDESRLDKIAETRVGVLSILLYTVLGILLALVVSLVVLIFTPLNRLLPGSLDENQRLLTRQSIMRIDSLSEVVNANQAWLDNFSRVTDRSREAGDSVAYAVEQGDFEPDSIMGASPLEQRFVSEMEERKRFNISVLAPLDADGMAFVPVSPQAVVTQDSRQSKDAVIMVADDTPVQAIADGTVLAVYPNATLRGFTVLVQHARGFVSAYSHLGNPLVSAGDAVNGGQAIAFAPAPDARKLHWIQLRIWHNGSQVVPADLIPLHD